METIVIFTGCHSSQRHTIEQCSPYMVETFRRMAARHGWPMTVKKDKNLQKSN